MGMSTIAAYIVIFLSMMAIMTGIAMNHLEYRDEMSKSLEAESEILEFQLGTGMDFVSIDYSDPTTTMIVENSGKTDIPLDLDLILDSEYISRSERTISLVQHIRDSENWNPGETINITFERSLSIGLHNVTVVALYGASANSSFLTYDTLEEILVPEAGIWTPGHSLNSSELLAVGNDGGTSLSLLAPDDEMGLNMSSTSQSPLSVTDSRIFVDYDSDISDEEFHIAGRNGSYDAELLCEGFFNSTIGEETAELACPLDVDTIQDIYINMTTNSTEEIVIDYVRINVTYFYQP